MQVGDSEERQMSTNGETSLRAFSWAQIKSMAHAIDRIKGGLMGYTMQLTDMSL